MAASPRPTTRTESTCTTETARGTHAFRIVGYSLQKGVGRDNFIRSANFAVGGYDWAVRFYPEGDSTDLSEGHVSVHLELRSKGTEARALFDFRLVDRDSGMSKSIHSSRTSVFRSGASDKPCCVWGFTNFMKRTTLEASQYLKEDCLVIECDVTVIKESQVVEAAVTVQVQVPPPDLQDSLAKLLESEEAADVTFKVKGEVIRGHKIMLALRSPVFKAELYGPFSGKRRQIINVEDMEPSVFKALLHFIYTDSLPAMDDLDADVNGEMVKHLLVAADRYGVDRMKLICESILCKRLDVESVTATLALADQYHCSELKDACIGFVSSSNRMHEILSSQGYEHLKKACPDVFMDIFERAAKSRKI